MDKIETAIAQLRQGGMIVVVDDENRENEGDLVAAASLIEPQHINFMITHGRGLVCLALPVARANQLHLPIMQRTAMDHDHYGTAFTFSIDARCGITTGISASDRAHTIKLSMQTDVKAEDFVVPGHIFPLRAKEGGVLTRRGHTEAAVDLTRLAGLEPGGVICEILNEDGTMMRLPALHKFATQNQLPLVSIEDLVQLRKKLEATPAEANLPTRWGNFKIRIYPDKDGKEHVVLWRGDLTVHSSPPLVRVHSECLTGDVFGSKKCDCGEQLQESLSQIAAEPSGMIIYLRQEGRGIGLMKKIQAYALQEQGLDTVEANQALGCPVDSRTYEAVIQILSDFGLKSIRLLSNNPSKIISLQQSSIDCNRIPLIIPPQRENAFYQQIKQTKLGHLQEIYL
jgi:3,4-dihydroxy 2-butanone 4-phosphate synthase/GTP cyclohydrolase II